MPVVRIKGLKTLGMVDFLFLIQTEIPFIMHKIIYFPKNMKKTLKVSPVNLGIAIGFR